MFTQLSSLRSLSVCLIIVVSLLLMLQRPSRANSLLSEYAALKQAVNDSVLLSAAVADNKPALVEFYADWCSVCRSMAPTVAQLRAHYGEQVNFVMLDIDDPRWSEQVQEFGVIGVPHFAFISDLEESPFGSRQLQQTLVGRQPAYVMAAALEDLSIADPTEN